MGMTLDELRASFSGFIHTPTSPTYHPLLHRWSPNEEASPALILEPLTERDVAHALRHATSNSLPVAVVAGGHSFLGASSAAGGVHVDLRRLMRRARVANESFGADGVLTVEGGASVGDVAAACVARGVGISLPAVKDLGFFGWALGGGAGWGMGVEGFVVDAWESARVVLASGEAVTASRDENPDLFWALRGAGYNFGVVTSLTLRVGGVPGGKVFYAELFFPPPAFAALFAAVETYAATLQGEEDTLALAYLSADDKGAPGETMQAILYFHGADEAEARRRFAPIFAVQPHLVGGRCGLERIHVACDAVEPLLPRTRRYADGTLFASVAYEAWRPVIERVRAWVEVDDARRKGTAFFFGVYNWRKTLSRHGDPRFESAWPDRSRLPPAGEQSWRDFALYISTDKPEEEDEAIRVSKEIVSLVRAKQEEVLGIEKGSFEWPVYPNGSLLPGTTGAYVFKDNYPRPQKIKEKYDPGNVLHKKHPIELP